MIKASILRPWTEMLQRIASLTPLQDVLARIDALVKPVAAQRIYDLSNALGRIVAEDITAGPVPTKPIALRDGWALPSDLTIDASSYAPASVPSAIRIDVGEILPTNANSVAPLDAVITCDGEMQVLAPVAPGEGVLSAGGEVSGDVALICAGEKLDAPRIALLAALDIMQAKIRLPRLCLTRAQPGPDRVLDSVTACISAAIGQAGGAPRIPSTGDVLEHALQETDVDAFVVVGGTGCGRKDNAVETLVSVGSVHAHGIAIIPAETAAFGTIGPRPVLLLPGRLDAALAAWHMLGRAILMKLTASMEPPCLRAATLTRKVSSAVGLAELVPVRCEGALATPLGSGFLPISLLCRANGWILIPPESEGQPEESQVMVRAWP